MEQGGSVQLGSGSGSAGLTHRTSLTQSVPSMYVLDPEQEGSRSIQIEKNRWFL